MIIHSIFNSHKWKCSSKDEMGPWLPFFIIYHAIRNIKRNKIPNHVVGLAFISALVVVPLLVLSTSALALLGFFSGQDGLTPLVRQILPDMAPAILLHLNGFALQYAMPIMGGSALVFFGLGVLLFQRTEGTFNAIWMSPRKWSMRNFLVSLPPLLFLGPLFLGASFILSAQFQFNSDGDVSIVDIALAAMISFTFFSLLHFFLPRARVRLPAALVGGLITTVGFELAKYAFNAYLSIAILEPENKVYGTMALLPLFIVGLYGLWFIVLFSAELAYASQHLQSLLTLQRAEERAPMRKQDRIYNPYIAIELFVPIAAGFKNGDKPLLERELSELTGYSAPIIRQVVESLVKIGALVTVLDDGGEIRLMPSKQLDDIQLLPMIDSFFDTSDVNSDLLEGLYAGLLNLNLTLSGKSALCLIERESDGHGLLEPPEKIQTKLVEPAGEQSSVLIYRHPNFTTPARMKKFDHKPVTGAFPSLFSTETSDPDAITDVLPSDEVITDVLKSDEIYVLETEELSPREYVEPFDSFEVDALVDIAEDESEPGLVERSLSELLEDLGGFDLSPPVLSKEAKILRLKEKLKSRKRN